VTRNDFNFNLGDDDFNLRDDGSQLCPSPPYTGMLLFNIFNYVMSFVYIFRVRIKILLPAKLVGVFGKKETRIERPK